MIKTISSTFFLLATLFVAAFFIYDGSKQRDNHDVVDEKINNLQLIDQDLNVYIKNSLQYENFDNIQKIIDLYKDEYQLLSQNNIFKSIDLENLHTLLGDINKNMLIKTDILEEFKSDRAILNNSFRIVQKLYTKSSQKQFDDLNLIIMTLDKNPNINIKNELSKLDTYKVTNEYEKYYLHHARIILEYELRYNASKIQLDELQVGKKLQDLQNLYHNYAQGSIQKSNISIVAIFIIILILIIIDLVNSLKLRLYTNELITFRTAVQNSENSVMITDAKQVITYVNEAFIKKTGYSYNEIIGKKPNILKSGFQSKEFYKDLNETIYGGQKWYGMLVNKNKSGNLIYERASIMPIIGKDDKMVEFIAIKLDITQETLIMQELEKNKYELQELNESLNQKIEQALAQNTKQLETLQQQNKLASMGEMIGAIAHQWRQPLNEISISIQNTKYDFRNGEIDEAYIQNFIDENKKVINFMSKTIDDFRDFFRVDKEKSDFKVLEAIESVVSMQSAQLKNHNISLNITGDEIIFNGLQSEFQQVILNLINNAKDILVEKQIENPTIEIDCSKVKSSEQDNNAPVVTVSDNGGGIPQEIIDRIFEPYFTTKEQGKGTGMGLYMSKMIIEENMGGSLSVTNTDVGARFMIDFAQKPQEHL